MSLKMPINHEFNIKCPKCNHNYPYSVKIDDIKESKPKDIKTKYEFVTYVICKNPICNYDIELKGFIWEYPENSMDNIELIKVK